MNIERLTAVLALCAALGLASSSFAQEAKGKRQLVGLWQLESLYTELKNGEKRHNFGEKPRGYVYFSPGGRAVSHFTASERPRPKTDADMAAAFKTMYSLGGTYKEKGNTYTLTPETAYNESMVGSEFKREFTVKGNQLIIVTAWAPSIFLEGNPEARSVSVWKRAK